MNLEEEKLKMSEINYFRFSSIALLDHKSDRSDFENT